MVITCYIANLQNFMLQSVYYTRMLYVHYSEVRHLKQAQGCSLVGANIWYWNFIPEKCSVPYRTQLIYCWVMIQETCSRQSIPRITVMTFP